MLPPGGVQFDFKGLGKQPLPWDMQVNDRRTKWEHRKGAMSSAQIKDFYGEFKILSFSKALSFMDLWKK